MLGELAYFRRDKTLRNGLCSCRLHINWNEWLLDLNVVGKE